MLKKLLGRHRALRLGATVVGASALVVGFASPAFAGNQGVNNGNADNAPAQNYLVVEGGSNTTYLMMQALSDIFNRAPGCDLVGQAGADQPLDYGCAGLNGDQGTPQPAAQTTAFTGVTLTAGSKNVSVSSTAALAVDDQCYDSLGGFAQSDETITSIKSATKFKIKSAVVTSETNDTVTCVTTPQAGENGFTDWGSENPFNDVLVEEPAYGSGNGIQELEGTGSSTVVGHSNNTNDPAGFGPVNVSPLDIARSSRAPKVTSSGDYQGLNFVAYAEDAVTYLSWSKLGASSTDAAKCLASSAVNNNPTTAELKLIWNETYTGGVPNETWNSVFGCTTAGSSNPIYAYWAQNGSGTEATWNGATGAAFDGSNPSTWPARNTVFENETQSILRNAGTEPLGDVMFFFSYGKYNQICTPTPATAAGEASTNPTCSGTGNTVELGTRANGVTLTPTTIDDQLPGLEGASYFGDRLVYNVYSNGSNPNIPQSAAAAENIVSEDGFLCKPSTKEDIDPNSGSTYQSEIDAAIVAQGFYPLPHLQVEDGQGDSGNTNPGYDTTASGIPHPAWNYTGDTGGLKASNYNAANETGSPWNFNPVNTDTDNSAVSGTYNGVEDDSSTLANGVIASPTAPVGYCITLSTDGSAAGQ